MLRGLPGAGVRGIVESGLRAMRYVEVAGAKIPLSQAVLGTEDYFPESFDHHAAMLDAYVAGGGNALDSGRIYAIRDGIAYSESVIGKWMAERGNRERIIVITKGIHPPSGQSLGRITKPEIDADIAASLDALASDYIDVWLFHRDNPEVDVGAIMDWVNPHLDAGRIRAVGASNWSLDRFERANAYAANAGLTGFALLSNHFGLATQRVPRFAGCLNVKPGERTRLRATGKPNLAWSAQCGGFFAGIYDPADRSNQPMVDSYYVPENWDRLARARQLAAQLGISPVQVALAYTLNQEFGSLGVFWTANQAELDEALQAADIELAAGQLAFLETGD